MIDPFFFFFFFFFSVAFLFYNFKKRIFQFSYKTHREVSLVNTRLFHFFYNLRNLSQSFNFRTENSCNWGNKCTLWVFSKQRKKMVKPTPVFFLFAQQVRNHNCEVSSPTTQQTNADHTGTNSPVMHQAVHKHQIEMHPLHLQPDKNVTPQYLKLMHRPSYPLRLLKDLMKH